VQGAGHNRDGLGAQVALTAGALTQRRTVMPTRSYPSQVELPVTFGLETSAQVERVEVSWPDGSRVTVTEPEVDRVLVVAPSERGLQR
jgi:hypothetical protein